MTYDDPEQLNDQELAEEYKSFYLQVQNPVPSGKSEVHRLIALTNEMSNRDLEVLDSVRILNSDEEVLAE